MNPNKKAEELIEKFTKHVNGYVGSSMLSNTEYPETILENAKQCALICVENEYHEKREMLFNLRSCGVIENPNTYLVRLQELIDEEQQVKELIINHE